MYPSTMETCVSRNSTREEDQLVVNLMVGWWPLRSWMNLLRWSSPCVQTINTSSMYIHQARGFRDCVERKSCSNLPIYMLA